MDNRLNNEGFVEFTNRLSGKNSEGSAKAEVIYQTFAVEDDEESRDRTTFYSFTNCVVNIYRSRIYPQLVTLDLIFGSSDDAELKLLWGRLQKQKKNEQEHPEKTWVFNFTMTERAGVESFSTIEKKPLLIAYLNNPIMSYITREIPSMQAEERIFNGELVGGNIVRMLIPAEYVAFELNEDIDTDQIITEVDAAYRNEEYINNYEVNDSGANWN